MTFLLYFQVLSFISCCAMLLMDCILLSLHFQLLISHGFNADRCLTMGVQRFLVPDVYIHGVSRSYIVLVV